MLFLKTSADNLIFFKIYDIINYKVKGVEKMNTKCCKINFNEVLYMLNSEIHKANKTDKKYIITPTIIPFKNEPDIIRCFYHGWHDLDFTPRGIPISHLIKHFKDMGFKVEESEHKYISPTPATRALKISWE